MPVLLLALRLEQGSVSGGRIQSREYTKKITETECEKRIAYEVSISKLSVMNFK